MESPRDFKLVNKVDCWIPRTLLKVIVWAFLDTKILRSGILKVPLPYGMRLKVSPEGRHIFEQLHPQQHRSAVDETCDSVCVCVNSATDALGLSHNGLSRLRAGLPAHLGAAVNKVEELPYNSPPKQVTSPAKDRLHLHPLCPPGVRAPRCQVTKAAPTKTCDA